MNTQPSILNLFAPKRRGLYKISCVLKHLQWGVCRSFVLHGINVPLNSFLSILTSKAYAKNTLAYFIGSIFIGLII